MKTLLLVLALVFVGAVALPDPVSPWVADEIATLHAQAPAAKLSTPPVSAPVTAKAEPLPELTRLKVENLQLQAEALGLRLKQSEAYQTYEKAMAELGKAMDTILAAETKACFTVDQVARTRTPIAGCKAGK